MRAQAIRMACAGIVCAVFGSTSPLTFATDIGGGANPYGITLLPGALDQPKINVILRRNPGDNPLNFDADDPTAYIANAFLDTGASGHLLSNETAGITSDIDPDDPTPGLGIIRQQVGGQYATFQDVGGGGAVQFHISEPLYLQMAAHNQSTAFSLPGFGDFHPTLSEFYPAQANPVRFQVGAVPRPGEFDPLRGLDVIGMPAMKGKVVVMDNRGLNRFALTQDLEDADVMDTYLYNPGTPFNAADAAEPQLSVDPGIPNVDRRIKLSYANFDAFSTTSPGAQGPALEANPFIGKDPVRARDGISQPDVPGIKVRHVGSDDVVRSAEGSFLLDTGAGASFISKSMAAQLGIHYKAGNEPGDPLPEPGASPILVDALGNEVDGQFTVSISAFGADDPATDSDSSAITIAGFYLHDLLVRTMEGDVANDSDPAHLRYFDAPVLVYDISTSRMVNGELQTITLDGIFGMNFLAASGIPPTSIFDPPITAPGAFDWIVYDDVNGTLGVTFAGSVPEPTSLAFITISMGLVLRRRQRV